MIPSPIPALEHAVVAKAEPAKGKFRTFLLASLRHFLANEWDRTQAQTPDHFNPAVGVEGSVCASAMQADGKTLAGGYFTTPEGQVRGHRGRLNNIGAATRSLEYAGSTITGENDKPYRVQTSTHLAAWSDLWTYTNAEAVTAFLEVTVTNGLRRCYRVVSP